MHRASREESTFASGFRPLKPKRRKKLGGTGPALAANSPEISSVRDEGEALGEATAASDADLAELIHYWPALPAVVRDQILGLVRASQSNK